MNHDKATEEFFRLRGWKKKTIKISTGNAPPEAVVNTVRPGSYLTKRWVEPNGERHKELPKICDSMTDWIKYVAEFMEGEGLFYEIVSDPYLFRWHTEAWIKMWDGFIEDHQILYASVLAANEYLKGRKG